MDTRKLEELLLELIRRTSMDLPPDIENALKAGWRREKAGSPAKTTFKTMRSSARLSRSEGIPLCQDTGAQVWHIHYPDGAELIPVEYAIRRAVAQATMNSYLRPNAVDPVTGENSGTNLGDGSPIIYFHPWKKKSWEFKLLLKGGGSENCGAQYKLPDSFLGAEAGRDLDGVYRCVIYTVWRAQGKGCAPGIICVCIGGNRDTGMAEAKRQGFRKLDDKNPFPLLAKLEKKLYRDCNKLGIGPMGCGGKTTVLGVKIGRLHRLPACFFVSISYLCWSARRCTMTLRGNTVKYFN
ncbi:MAG: fumarate hydratase [bacterium]